jgi:hypothetical protein
MTVTSPIPPIAVVESAPGLLALSERSPVWPRYSGLRSPDPFTRTREEWIQTVAFELIAPWFQATGFTFPRKVRFSCGFPSGDARVVIGQCWDPRASADGTFEIFLSPRLAAAEDVLAVLVHEMVHAAVGIPAGHSGIFRDCATKLGLVGPMPSTVAGPLLMPRLHAIKHAAGAYPHAELRSANLPPMRLPTWQELAAGTERSLWPCGTRCDSERRQRTRMRKVVCPSCGYTVRTTQKWICRGLPTCCCGAGMSTTA